MACFARCLPAAVLCVLLLQACTTRPAVDPATAVAVQSAHAVIRAESAWRDDGRFFIRYRTDGEVAYSTGAIRRPDNDAEILTAGQQGAIPTQVSLEAMPEAAWPADPAGTWTPLTILSASHWESVFRQLRERLTPAEPHTGAVIDILQLQEWFSWYDEADTLRWALIEDKPAAVRVKYSYRFEHVLTVLGRVLADYLPAAGITARQLLLNTGATGPDRTPFVYADLDSGRVLFLTSRPADGRAGDGKGGAAHVRATTHLIIGQVRSLIGRPVSSLGRLFARSGQDVLDTVHRTVLLPQPAGDVPPPGSDPGMDLAAWEQQLDDITGTQSVPGRMHFLVDGVEFFPRLIDVLQSAGDSIDIRMYIFDDDDYAIKIADILKARSRDVGVRVLLDGLGTIGAAAEEAESLPADHRAPGSIFTYLESDSTIRVKSISNFALTGDHSKSIIVDDQIGFIGGMNIGREYRYDWHDMMIELEGPVLEILREDFFRAWIRERFLGDLQLMLRRFKPAVREAREDDYPVRVLFTRPADSQIYRAQVAAIRNARNYIYIENAYFTDDVVLDELIKARARGVDVRVILPLRSDFGVMKRNNALVANTLLENGIRVFIYPGMSHLKAAVYDGWICLGSANLDKFSLRINREINVATSHPLPVNELLQRVFLPDMQASVELNEPFPENWLDFLVEMLADQL